MCMFAWKKQFCSRHEEKYKTLQSCPNKTTHVRETWKFSVETTLSGGLRNITVQKSPRSLIQLVKWKYEIARKFVLASQQRDKAFDWDYINDSSSAADSSAIRTSGSQTHNK